MYLKFILSSLVILTLTGCGHDHEREIHSENEEAKVQYTVYTDRFELFAEADPFVSGHVSNVLSHFTCLPRFTALGGGEITLKIIVNGISCEQTLGSTEREGIYSFDIKPETSGNGIMEYLIKTDSGNYKVTVPDIIIYSSSGAAMEAAAKNMTANANTIVFTKDQSWKTDFSTAYPLRKPFGQVIKTTALVQPSQGDEVMVTAKTNGIVLLPGKSILEGMRVLNDQALLTIRGSGLAENNSSVRYAEALNNFEKARADYERTNLLAAERIVSEKALLEARTEYENARSVYENLKEDFNASGQSVTSPMTGFITQLFVKNGQYVESGQPLLIISQNKSLYLRAEVQLKYAPYLHSITGANIRTVEDNRAYSLDELNGKVLSVGMATTPDNFMIPVTLQVDNTGSFVPGSFVEIFLKTISNSQALVVPDQAIIEEQGSFFVFVQITPELFEKREIKTGASDGKLTEIISGLSDNDRIVMKGAALIRLSQATGSLDAHSGHVH